MKPSYRRLGLTLVACGALLALAELAGSVALAQQPQPGPGALPGGHPPFPGMPPAGPARTPIMLGPDGRPVPRPGMPGGFPAGHPGMPGMPGMPPGFPQRPRVPQHEREEEHAEEHEDPEAPPPPINLWHGMLMVDNERAEQGGFLNHLLFRYENPKNHGDPRNEPAPFLASVLNFGVLAYILYRFGRKPMAEGLLRRK
jgi:F-type H+-transporting ATPase subunit b